MWFQILSDCEKCWSCFCFCKRHRFCLSAQDFSLGILAALIHQGRKIDLNLCVKFCFGDLLCLLVKTTFLWPSTFLVFESCWLALSWKLSFWSFGLCFQTSHCCFGLLKESQNTSLLLSFHPFCVVNLQSARCRFFNHKVSVLLRALLKRHFCFAFEENFLKNLVLLSWALFWVGFLLVNESYFCLSWNLFLLFRCNEW